MTDLPFEATAPNWAEITTEPQCPLCEYMLRGLTVPRCPECGFKFNWPEVLDASKREHPYLFEHHPEGNIWSFFRTMLGAMRPRRFWSLLHPSQYGSIKRLVLYGFINLVIVSLFILIQPLLHLCFDYCYDKYAVGQSNPNLSPSNWGANWIPGITGQFIQSASLPTVLGQACSTTSTWDTYGFIWILIASWPLLTHASLQLYGISMHRAKIKPVHVFRCVLYSYDATLPCIAIGACTVGVFLEIVRSYIQGYAGFWRVNFSNEAIPWMLGALLINGYRLGVAYSRYLRFRHVAFVAASSQIITFLLLTFVYAMLHIY